MKSLADLGKDGVGGKNLKRVKAEEQALCQEKMNQLVVESFDKVLCGKGEARMFEEICTAGLGIRKEL